MAVNPNAAAYATSQSDKNRAVVDVDIKRSDNHNNNAASGKSMVVTIAGTIGADGTFTPGFSAGGGGGGTTFDGKVQGNVGSGAVDAGNPVKVGAFFTTTLPTFTSGQRADLQTDSTGNLRVYTTYAVITGNDGQSNNSLGRPGANTIQNNQVMPINASYYFNNTGWDRMRGDVNGAWSVSKGSSTFATAQAAVTTSATQIVAARANRGSVKITNLGTTDIYLGVSGVTTTTGDLLIGTKGASVTIPTNAAVFAVGAAAGSVSVMEVF